MGMGLGMFIPFVGPAINYAIIKNAGVPEGTTETVTISFDPNGIVSDVNVSSYSL
jgi:hypothetical protein